MEIVKVWYASVIVGCEIVRKTSRLSKHRSILHKTPAEHRYSHNSKLLNIQHNIIPTYAHIHVFTYSRIYIFTYSHIHVFMYSLLHVFTYIAGTALLPGMLGSAPFSNRTLTTSLRWNWMAWPKGVMPTLLDPVQPAGTCISWFRCWNLIDLCKGYY